MAITDWRFGLLIKDLGKNFTITTIFAYFYEVNTKCYSYKKHKKFMNSKTHKVEKILKGSLDSIPSPSPSVKSQIMGGKFAWGVKAKHCCTLSTNFWKQKFCWHQPAMFCLYTSSKLSTHNLNFHWRWRWWDWIWVTFSNLFYFTFKFLFLTYIQFFFS